MAAALHSTGATSDVLRGYLRSEMIGPLPLLPPGRPHPHTADQVFRKILAEPHFTWSSTARPCCVTEKPWYYDHESHPHVAVIGARFRELIGR